MKTTNGTGVGSGSPEGKNVTGGNRPTMGTSVYTARPDAPSGTEFRAGAVSHKEGFGKGGSDAGFGSAPNRGRTTADSLGARYAIQIHHRPGFVENASTLANGRTVPSVISRSGSFKAQ